jgi:hypothetical protein
MKREKNQFEGQPPIIFAKSRNQKKHKLSMRRDDGSTKGPNGCSARKVACQELPMLCCQGIIVQGEATNEYHRLALHFSLLSFSLAHYIMVFSFYTPMETSSMSDHVVSEVTSKARHVSKRIVLRAFEPHILLLTVKIAPTME